MLSDGIVEQKRKLREKLRFRRRHFTANLDEMARLAAFRSLPGSLADLLDEVESVAAYAACGAEPDILPMLTGVTLLLPHHGGRVSAMDFRSWKAGDTLEKGPWGTPQPAKTAAAGIPELIFCPLVGFDRAGGRIGQGGGHYDRFFALHPGIARIGIAWSVQEVDTVPMGRTDVKLDAILTEQEFIVIGDRL